MRRHLVSILAAVLTALPLAGSIAPAAATGDSVLVGAGDIAVCTGDKDEATARLLDNIPGTVFTVGDNAYPDGKLAQFKNCYGPGWGRHKSRTRPVPGNHEYHTTGAAGYFAYFGQAASPLEQGCTRNCKGYYSYNLGSWHIIALNSEIEHSARSPQEQWLRADLARNGAACTLAYWHRPRFSSGRHGDEPDMAPLWQALYDYGADVVLSGHDHLYERFAPQDPQGRADSLRGIREFVVGTGGGGLYYFPTIRPNSQVRNNKTWGVLKLTLHSTSYDWKFVPIAGQTFTDSGTANCVAASRPDTIFLDNFDSPSLSPWSSASIDGGDLSVTSGAALVGTKGLQARIDDGNPLFVADDRPLGEPRYRLRFYFDPNSISMREGDWHVILNGISGVSTPVLRLEFGRFSGRYQLRSGLLNDTSIWLFTPWVSISDAKHYIELDWRAAAAPGANNGGLTLWLDGVRRAERPGVDNDTRPIDRVRLGAVAGMDVGTRGTYYFDAFVSRRRSYIGPAP